MCRGLCGRWREGAFVATANDERLERRLEYALGTAGGMSKFAERSANVGMTLADVSGLRLLADSLLPGQMPPQKVRRFGLLKSSLSAPIAMSSMAAPISSRPGSTLACPTYARSRFHPAGHCPVGQEPSRTRIDGVVGGSGVLQRRHGRGLRSPAHRHRRTKAQGPARIQVGQHTVWGNLKTRLSGCDYALAFRKVGAE